MSTSPICPQCKKQVHPEDMQHSVAGKVYHDNPCVLEQNCFENACRAAAVELGLQLAIPDSQSHFFA